MPYDNNVPLASDVIANTTDPIRNNFAFLQTDLQFDHSFNGNLAGVAEGAHGKCSMPSISLSPALGTLVSGVYFVNSSLAYFYDGTTNWNLNMFTGKSYGGTVALTRASGFLTVATLPANVSGYVLLYSTASNIVQFGAFMTTGTLCYGYGCDMESLNYINFLHTSPTTLDLKARPSINTYDGNYYYRIIYTS